MESRTIVINGTPVAVWDPEQLSRAGAISTGRLAVMRWQKTGPGYVKASRRVFYPVAECERFIASRIKMVMPATPARCDA